MITSISLVSEDGLHERVAACAYQLWLREGRPAGRALEHWTLAQELILRSDREAAACTARPLIRRPRQPGPRAMLVA